MSNSRQKQVYALPLDENTVASTYVFIDAGVIYHYDTSKRRNLLFCLYTGELLYSTEHVANYTYPFSGYGIITPPTTYGSHDDLPFSISIDNTLVCFYEASESACFIYRISDLRDKVYRSIRIAFETPILVHVFFSIYNPSQLSIMLNPYSSLNRVTHTSYSFRFGFRPDYCMLTENNTSDPVFRETHNLMEFTLNHENMHGNQPPFNVTTNEFTKRVHRYLSLYSQTHGQAGDHHSHWVIRVKRAFLRDYIEKRFTTPDGIKLCIRYERKLPKKIAAYILN